ncbi:MAG: ABC transporter permease subunit [Blastocatellia bacterium]|nr:ABC transporter permease subunit [Blastocatellia bacterium]
MRYLLILLLLLPTKVFSQQVIGSKKFTESYVLAEIAKRKLEEAGIKVEHRQGLGGTTILWEAMRTGAVDFCPDYTGTIREAILQTKTTSLEGLRAELAPFGVGLTESLGFNNTYALAVRREMAEKLGLKKVSDLKVHQDLKVGLTHEFQQRSDGWGPFTKHYGLNMEQVKALEHALAYQAIRGGQIDVMDAYSTDAKLAEYDLVVLQDDLNFFPRYDAVFLYRLDADPKAIEVIKTLVNTIDEEKMVKLNLEAEKKADYVAAANLYFSNLSSQKSSQSVWQKILYWTIEHLFLVAASMLVAVGIGLPLGVAASRQGLLSQAIFSFSGIVQTIPSLALLALLVPLLGISQKTAIVALALYSLLPIVRNTAAGLQDIPSNLRESAQALGLEQQAILLKVYLPMASRTILAGIKTSAVINVGTATLAALIGAGGLGEPIVSGLTLNNPDVILQGAIPAAILALLVEFLFELLDRLLIPKGLRLSS